MTVKSTYSFLVQIQVVIKSGLSQGLKLRHIYLYDASHDEDGFAKLTGIGKAKTKF